MPGILIFASSRLDERPVCLSQQHALWFAGDFVADYVAKIMRARQDFRSASNAQMSRGERPHDGQMPRGQSPHSVHEKSCRKISAADKSGACHGYGDVDRDLYRHDDDLPKHRLRHQPRRGLSVSHRGPSGLPRSLPGRLLSRVADRGSHLRTIVGRPAATRRRRSCGSRKAGPTPRASARGEAERLNRSIARRPIVFLALHGAAPPGAVPAAASDGAKVMGPRALAGRWPLLYPPGLRQRMHAAMRVAGIIGTILAAFAVVLVWFYRTGPLCFWGC